ncbi:hypothetical protein ABW19_dt0200674 [Dactylella cylindrospora]|nr:hypothetical protein ABW19_dt0200674 [Dactylella cylindrospora]
MASTDNPPHDPALQRSNQCLEALHEIFPEADVGDLRYRINAKFKEHIELSEQLKMLLEQSQMGKQFKQQPGGSGNLQPWERFRSQDYVKAVEQNLRKEFKNLSKSTILAVMAENNNHYARSRTILIDITKKSWRHKITSWFSLRPKTEEFKAIPKLNQTGCKELDDEIWELGKGQREEQSVSDHAAAQELNEKEYEEAGDSLECECCFGDYAFEAMAACCHGHLFCHSCVEHAAKEGVYGQTTSLIREKGSLRCLSSVADPPCDGYIPLDLVSKALPEEILRAMEDKFTEDDITTSGLPIAKCPFCMYAEADEIPSWKMRKDTAYGSIALAIFLVTTSFILFILPATMMLAAVGYIYVIEALSSIEPVHMENVAKDLMNHAVKRQWEKKRGQMFQCRNSAEVCAKKSCRDCGKEWKPFHKCFENEEEALRLCMENAMAAAIKRTVSVTSIFVSISAKSRARLAQNATNAISMFKKMKLAL